MIAVAANSASALASRLSVNWFDLVFVAVLIFGLIRGRRNGLSRELLPMLQWIALVIVCGMGYPSIADILTTCMGQDGFRCHGISGFRPDCGAYLRSSKTAVHRASG